MATPEYLMGHYGLSEDDCIKEVSDWHTQQISCEHWRKLPSCLGLETTTVSDLERDFKTEEERRIGLLKKWKKMKGFDATYKVLIKALLDIESREDAEGVCKLLVHEQDTHGNVVCSVSDGHCLPKSRTFAHRSKSTSQCLPEISPPDSESSASTTTSPNESSEKAHTAGGRISDEKLKINKEWPKLEDRVRHLENEATQLKEHLAAKFGALELQRKHDYAEWTVDKHSLEDAIGDTARLSDEMIALEQQLKHLKAQADSFKEKLQEEKTKVRHIEQLSKEREEEYRAEVDTIKAEYEDAKMEHDRLMMPLKHELDQLRSQTFGDGQHSDTFRRMEKELQETRNEAETWKEKYHFIVDRFTVARDLLIKHNIPFEGQPLDEQHQDMNPYRVHPHVEFPSDGPPLDRKSVPMSHGKPAWGCVEKLPRHYPPMPKPQAREAMMNASQPRRPSQSHSHMLQGTSCPLKNTQGKRPLNSPKVDIDSLKLTCPICKRRFNIGRIQEYKRHVDKCDG